jgi:hypothetical protein
MLTLFSQRGHVAQLQMSFSAMFDGGKPCPFGDAAKEQEML